MPIARLSSKSQIVIPSELRKKLAIEPGDELMLEARDDSIVITRASSSALARLRALSGPAWSGASEQLQRDRDEWDR
ncbi:MAG TPA: AbrB/MazE/SpoVT family DNA-binding domain-containing protein [Longimicrobiaceae bacterium]|nr:AbrB/MazE/SpoVT family DNA-binding domain-containing protein [Longimicrobiaceae bacterium]